MNIFQTIILLLLFIPIISFSQAQRDTLNFLLTPSNNISVQATLNHQDTLQLMFHTAASGVTLTEEAIERIQSIRFASEEDTVKSWGGESTARYSDKNILQMSHQTWESVGIWENKYSGPGTDGKFGPNFFKDYILEINFTNNYLILHPTLPNIDSYKRIDLFIENGMMFMDGSAVLEGQPISNRFLIHSGYGGSILFDDQFVNKHTLGEKIDITSESELKDSYGNILRTKKGILPHFIISDLSFKDVPVGFFEGAIGRQKMSVMGGELLKRFDLIFDIQNSVAYLKKREARSQK